MNDLESDDKIQRGCKNPLQDHQSSVVPEKPCLIRMDASFITPHAQRERGKVIGCGVHLTLSTSKACNFTHPPRTGDAYAREYSMYVGTS